MYRKSNVLDTKTGSHYIYVRLTRLRMEWAPFHKEEEEIQMPRYEYKCSSCNNRFELRQGSPKARLLASVKVKATGEGKFLELPAKLKNARGLSDVCVVAKTKGVLGLNWIEFQK